MDLTKLKGWFSKKENLILLGIILFAAIIRIYFFYLTKNQPIWWDESDYLAYAKTLANIGETSWIVTSQHNSLFSFLVAGFFLLNFSEPLIKFILVLIPSIFIVPLTYFICTSLYSDKRIAYISSFIIAVFWEMLFNSMRFHVDVPALFLAFLAIYTFFIGYERKEKIFGFVPSKWAIPLTVAFTIFAYAIRRNYIFFGLFFAFYLLSTKDIKSLLKDKYNWVGLGIAIFLLFLTELFLFSSSIGGVAGEYYHPENNFNWQHLKAFSLFFSGANVFESIFLWFFYLGLILVIFNLAISFDLIRKERVNESKSDLFLIISIFITLSYFIFFQRGTTVGETRWYFPILLAAIVLSSKGIIYFASKLEKYKKSLSLIIIIILVLIGGYYQLFYGNQVIVNKIPSYDGIRQAGLYLNQVSSNEDVIVSVPVPQTAYYSERLVYHPGNLLNKTSSSNVSLEEFLLKIEQNSSIKYVLVSFSEPNHPSWMRDENGEYGYDANGNVIRVKLEIPFMDTVINFQTGEQKIIPEKTYGNITFKLIQIKQDVFIYEILRNSPESR